MKQNILIVEDDNDLRMIYATILEEEGYIVFRADSYKSAMNVLGTESTDLVVSDIMLGKMSGVDLLREVKEKVPSCPVVLITGVPTVETAAEAVRLGAYDYIPKPVTPETLIRITSNALRFKDLHDKYETSRKNLEAIFSSVKDAIVTVDDNLRVIEMNEAAQGFCGLRDNMIGSSLDPLLREYSKDLLTALRETIDKKITMELMHVDCLCDGINKKIISASIFPLVRNDDCVSGVVMIIRDHTRIVDLERELKERRQFHGIVGGSSEMQEIYSLIEDMASVNTTVLVTGETGTGKELIAEALHYIGDRKDQPMVRVNCAALSENLLDSELFGHVKGAFTGAIKDKIGKFEMAENGTIFLDEIGDITPALQTKLLRVLQDKKIEWVGGTVSKQLDVRVVTATNQDLRAKIRKGLFRSDLFYRLKVVEIKLPPLRDRRGDIPFLVGHFLSKLQRKHYKTAMSVSDEVMDIFMENSWPGNIRELEHELEYAYIRCRNNVIHPDDLSSDLTDLRRAEQAGSSFNKDDVGQITGALEKSGGNKAKAARMLGMSRGTLYKLIKQHGLENKME